MVSFGDTFPNIIIQFEKTALHLESLFFFIHEALGILTKPPTKNILHEIYNAGAKELDIVSTLQFMPTLKPWLKHICYTLCKRLL